MRTIFSILMLAFATVAYAQKIVVEKGSLATLKGQTEINTEFTYDNMAVGKFDKEDDYVNDRKQTMNGKEAGSGDKWAVNWVEDRKNRYEPKFHELFNKESGANGGYFPSAKYTLILHTSFTEPGFNVGVMRKNAAINAEAIIVETENRDNVVCKIKLIGAQGGTAFGYDFDTGLRISECYAVCGKRLGGMVKKGK